MKKIIAAVITGLVFTAFTFAVKSYDVSPIGPGGTDVGFSRVNAIVYEAIGFHQNWYDLTDALGYAVIAICMLFALVGLVQLIKRRSLMKVDREILLLGLHFVVVMGFYVLFEKLVINYRPIIMEGESAPEPSYPSSHTVLVVTVMIAVAIIIGKYIKNRALLTIARVLCVLVTIVMIGGRLYSGVHWFTDIVGGLLLSSALIFAFAGLLDVTEAGPESEQVASPAGAGRGYKPKH